MSFETSFIPTDHSQYGIIYRQAENRKYEQVSKFVHVIGQVGSLYKCIELNINTAKLSSRNLLKDSIFLLSKETIRHLCKSQIVHSYLMDILILSSLALKDWATPLSHSIKMSDRITFSNMVHAITKISIIFQKVLSARFGLEEQEQLAEMLCHEVVSLNAFLGFGVILYEDKALVSVRTHSPIALYKLHTSRETPVAPLEAYKLNITFRFQALSGPFCEKGEYMELLFSIYDPISKLQLSDNFLILVEYTGTNYIQTAGQSYNPTSDSLSCSFQDFEMGVENLQLLCRISRYSTISSVNLEKRGPSDFIRSAIRRAKSKRLITSPSDNLKIVRTSLGFSSLALAPLLKNDLLNVPCREFNMPLNISSQLEDTKFDSAKRIAVQIGIQYDNDRPGSMMGSACISRYGISKGTLPASDANSIYLTLNSAKFTASKFSCLSLQILCRIRLPDGSFVKNAFFRDSSNEGQEDFSTAVILESADPVWNETVRIDLVPSIIQNAHLFLTFSNISAKFEGTSVFAFAFMPLAQSQSVMLNDGQHELNTYKYEEWLAIPENYLGFAAGPDILVPMHIALSSIKSISSAAIASQRLPALPHSISLSTYLSSSYFSQEVRVINFINWKRTGSLSRSPLREVVLQLQDSDDAELANMAVQIFHAFSELFFEMGGHQDSRLFDITLPEKEHIMASFVHFLSSVNNVRFQDRLDKLNQAIISQLSYKSFLPKLTEELIGIIQRAHTNTGQLLFKKMITIWHLIFRVILQSSGLDIFLSLSSIKRILNALNTFLALKSTDIEVKNSHIIALKYYDNLLLELYIFDEDEKLDIFRDTMNTIDFRDQSINCQRMLLINRVLLSKIYSSHTLAKLRGMASTWLFESTENLSYSMEITESTTIFIDCLQTLLTHIECLPITQPLCQDSETRTGLGAVQYLKIIRLTLSLSNSSDESSTDFFSRDLRTRATLLLSSIGIIMEMNYLAAIISFQDADSTDRLILQLLESMRSLGDPSDAAKWLGLEAQTLFSLSKYAEAIVSLLLKKQHSEEHLYIWSCFLDSAVTFFSCPSMYPTSLQKAEYFERSIPTICDSLKSSIEIAIGGMALTQLSVKKPKLFPQIFIFKLFGSAVEYRTYKLAGMAGQILIMCMGIEFQDTGNFKNIEMACFDKIHELCVSSTSWNSTYIISILRDHFQEKGCDPNLKGQGLAFLKGLNKLTPLILNIAECNSRTSKEFISSVIYLLRFLRHVRHKKLFVLYLRELFLLHLEKKDYIEAAITLKQQTQLIGWSHDTFVPPEESLGFQPWLSEFELNEELHLECIRLLDIGQAWERALELTRVLEEKYESWSMNYLKVAEILKLRVTLCEKLVEDHRSFPSYYRVFFLGLGFTNRLSGKQFVYRGDNWEHIASFCERLEKEYAPVKLIAPKAVLTEEELSDPLLRCLQVSAVTPVSDSRHWKTDGFQPLTWDLEQFLLGSNSKALSEMEETPLWLFTPELYWDNVDFQKALITRQTIPEHGSLFYDHNEVSMFSVSRPFRLEDPSMTDKKDPAKEFLELWTEKSVMFVECSLPCLSRRSRIERVLTFRLSPIENAIVAIRSKTRDLLDFECRFAAMDEEVSLSSPVSSILHSNRTSTISRKDSSCGSSTMNASPFSMALNGAVDAPVNGGIPMYKKAFLQNEAFANDSNKSLRIKLEEAILDQVDVIRRCVSLHGRVVSIDLRPLHLEIVKAFAKNFVAELNQLDQNSERLSQLEIFTSSGRKSSSRLSIHTLSSITESTGSDKLSPADFYRKSSSFTIARSPRSGKGWKLSVSTEKKKVD